MLATSPSMRRLTLRSSLPAHGDLGRGHDAAFDVRACVVRGRVCPHPGGDDVWRYCCRCWFGAGVVGQPGLRVGTECWTIGDDKDLDSHLPRGSGRCQRWCRVDLGDRRVSAADSGFVPCKRHNVASGGRSEFGVIEFPGVGDLHPNRERLRTSGRAFGSGRAWDWWPGPRSRLCCWKRGARRRRRVDLDHVRRAVSPVALLPLLGFDLARRRRVKRPKRHIPPLGHLCACGNRLCAGQRRRAIRWAGDRNTRIDCKL